MCEMQGMYVCCCHQSHMSIDCSVGVSVLRINVNVCLYSCSCTDALKVQMLNA